MNSILILNGPNLNLLGSRQPEIYGKTTLADIETICKEAATALGAQAICQQSNHEGELVDAIHQAQSQHDGIVLNAGAFTHTSIAIMDAITSGGTPTIELHLSNIHAREEFRHKSYISKVAIGQICGFGAFGYRIAIQAMLDHLANKSG